jgi:hypothetical protein
MKNLFFLLCCCLLFSCSDSFINHKLKAERIGECGDYKQSINMISNINGERYEFFSCIDDGFVDKDYKLTRTGDSIMVDFPKTNTKKKALYKLILDVDAKPRYHHIIIDGREILVVPAQK